MHFKHLTWTVKRIRDSKPEIDPKPQYQRGPVWGQAKKQLLIDSILNHFDIPKIYLRHVKGIGAFDYEVADGQQRLTAIWEFLADAFPLGDISGPKEALSNLHFSELPAKEQEALLDFELVIAVVYQATNDEIRELFARLQKGEKLTPPELRNSMASALGDVIRAMAITHKFFAKSPFSKFRFKTDDLLAHAYGLRLYNCKRDIKAADLAAMYKEYKAGIDQAHLKAVDSTLTFLDKLQTAEPNCIRTKWGFVDLFWVISNANGSSPDATTVAKKYKEFEQRRLKHTKNPGALLLSGKPASDRKLYEYIVAFQAGGGTKENIKTRHDVLVKELI
jgi:hypothetical protein